MAIIKESITIRKPASEVFAFACNFQNDPSWRSGVVEMQLDPPGPCRLGTRTREVLHFFGQKMITEGEVTEYEPNRHVSFRTIKGPLPVRNYREVIAEGEATRFTYQIEAEPQGLYRVFAPLMERSFRKQLIGDLQKLKQAVENL